MQVPWALIAFTLKSTKQNASNFLNRFFILRYVKVVPQYRACFRALSGTIKEAKFNISFKTPVFTGQTEELQKNLTIEKRVFTRVKTGVYTGMKSDIFLSFLTKKEARKC